MSTQYSVAESVFPSTVFEAQPWLFNPDCQDVSRTMLRPPSGLGDPIQYHKTAVRYVLECYGALMCKEDCALLEKVIGSRPTAQQTTEPCAHRSGADDLCDYPTNADVAFNGATFRPYSPFPPVIWDKGKGKGRADTTQYHKETEIKSPGPSIGISAAPDPFQDATNKTSNLQLSPITANTARKDVEFTIKKEDESCVVDLTSAEEPVSPSAVGKSAASDYKPENAQAEDNNAVELPRSEHAPDNPSELSPNETDRPTIKRKREEETETLVDHAPSGPIRSLRARKMQGPVVVEDDPTPKQVKNIAKEGDAVEVVSSASTGDTGIAAAPAEATQPVRTRMVRMKTGGKPPKRPAPVVSPSPTPPPRTRKKTARMTTGGKPPKRPTTQAPPPPPPKRQRRDLD